MSKIINSTSIGNTKQDNSKVVSKQPIKIKLTPEQIAALEKKKYEELINKNKGTLTEISRKDIESANKKDKVLEAIGWQDKAGKPSITQGLAKTVGASALIATGAGYSSPLVNTLSGLGKNVIAGAIGTEGFSMLDGRPATPKEIAIGTTMEAGLPILTKGLSSIYSKILGNKNIINVPKSTVKEVLPIVKKENTSQSVKFQIEQPTTNTLQLKSTMLGSPLEKQLSKDGMLSINSLQTHLNNQSTSIADRTMIQKVIDEKFAGQGKINYNDLRKAVSDEMVQLEKNFDSNYDSYGIKNIGYDKDIDIQGVKRIIGYNKEEITKAFKNRNTEPSSIGTIKRNIEYVRSNQKLIDSVPKENTSIVYSNKDKFGRGSTDHFKNEGTLGHSRILVSNEERDVMHILEQQSDYYQKNPHDVLLKQLNNVKKSYQEVLSDPEYNKDKAILDYWKNKIDEITERTNVIISSPNQIQKELLGKTHQERLLQENVAYAAQNGQTKMRYPTPETAAKIQGYTKQSSVRPIVEENQLNEVPTEIRFGEDGTSQSFYNADDYLPEHKTILKKYTDNPKMVKKVLGQDTRTVTDTKGNSWYEFDIPEAFRKGKAEIKALSTIGAVATGKDIIDNKTKYAYGGNMKNKYAIGGEVINTMPIKKKKYQTGGNSEEVPFWGTDNKGYTPEYLATLDTAKRNPVTMARLSKELPQVTSPEDLQRLGTDGKIGEVHNWLQRNTIKTTPLPQHTVAYRAKIGDVRVNSKQFVETHRQQFDKRLDEARNDSTTAYNEMMKKDFPGVTKIDNKNTPNELLTKIKGKPSAKNFEVKAKAYAYGGEVEKPKYFLGAVLGLAGQAASMIMQNNAQKKQVAAQNKLVAEENAKQMEQRIDTEEVSQRNFGSNTPMHSFYAKGGNLGVVPESVGMSVVKGAKHENGGVDYKQVEVEGGEVIKHEGSNDFIFSDRIAFDNERTYGDVAKQFAEQKGTIEKQVGMTLKKLDKFNKDYSKSGSKLKASTTNRLMEKTNLELAKLKEQDNQIEQQVEQLKEHQLQKGWELGIYDEQGRPKDTDGKFRVGGFVNGVWVPGDEPTTTKNNYGFTPSDFRGIPKSELPATENNTKTTETTTPTSNPNFIKGVGNFLGSNAGQAVMGIAGAGINLLTNINTSRNMSKLKTPTFVPTKIQDTSKVNMSATRQSIEDSANEQNTYAEQNFANPQVAAAMKAKVEADKLKRLGEVNQQEQTTNIGIEDSNIARRAQMESANNAGFQQKQLMDYQKTSQDINNASNVTAAVIKDTNDVMTNYRKGIMEERTIDMYGKAYAGSVSEELKAAMMDGVDLQKVRNMNVTEANDYLTKAGIADKDKLNKWLKYAK